MENNCRFCLEIIVEDSEKRSVNLEIKKMFKDVTNTELLDSLECSDAGDQCSFPQFSCDTCFTDLQKFSSTKSKLISTQDLLYSLYNSSKKEKDPMENDTISKVKVEMSGDGLESIFIKEELKTETESEVDATDMFESITVRRKRGKSRKNKEQKRISKRPDSKIAECPECNLKVTNLKVHIETTHLKIKKYFCDLCNRGFYVKKRLETHLKVHFDIKTYKCPAKNCNKYFVHPDNVKMHFKCVHQNEKNHKCETCKMAFKNASVLKSHVASKHTGERLYFCPAENCDKSFFYQSDFITHKKRAHGLFSTRNIKKSPVINSCTICQKVFSHKSALKKHQSVHEDDLSPCPICGALLKIGNHKVHIERMHLKTKDLYVCDVCQKGFFVKLRMLDHLKVHFKIKDISCDDISCDMMFTGRGAMLNHKKKVHLGRKLDQRKTCEYCGKVLPNKVVYGSHVRAKHTGERPYICDRENCTKAYYSSADLAKHKLKFHVVPEQCKICFKVVKNLERHTKTHEEKQFVCTYEENGQICNKRFTTETIMKRHVQCTHMGIKKYSCTQCDSHYFKVTNLKHHILNVHECMRIKCELCPTLVTRRDYYTRHIKLHHHELDQATKDALLEKIKNTSSAELFNSQK